MKAILGALLIGALMAGLVAPAAAWDNRDNRVTVAGIPPNVVYAPRPPYYSNYSSLPFYLKPPYVSFATPPAYSYPRGYWSYQWAPRVSTSYVWVHSYWSVDGRLIQAHYEPRVVDAGFWQRVWVSY
jgi:hypothetical protein